MRSKTLSVAVGVTMMSALSPQATPRASFLPALADAVLCVFKLLRIGPYGHA